MDSVIKPKWAINYEEGLCNKEWYSYWSVNIFFSSEDGGDNTWRTLYCVHSYEWAKIALDKFKDCLDSSVVLPTLKGLSPVMIEHANQMYRIIDVNIKSSVVICEYIKGNTSYGLDTPVLSTIGFDYIQESIAFYQFGDAVVQNNQLFLNGDLILNKDSFKNICKKVGQDLDHIDTHPDNLIKYIVETYPNVHRYICGNFTRNNIQNIISADD